jgi:hypothetical protein
MNPEDKTENGEVDTLGFHMPGRYDKILQIENCHLQAPLHNEIRNYIYEYAIQHGLEFYDLRKQEGLLRSIIIRNTTQGEWMLIFTFHRMEENVIFPLMKDVEAKFPQLTTIDYVINQKLNNVISDLDAVNFKGPGYMVEHMDNLQFRINPKAFYQTNGAYNVAVGPLSVLWRNARQSKLFPNESQIKVAKALIQFDQIDIDTMHHQINIPKAGMKLDLGSLGKGFIAQKALNYLKNKGVEYAMVDAGGKIVTMAPNKMFWTIGINQIRAQNKAINKTLKLSNHAVATSGDVYQFFIFKICFGG